MFQPCIEGGGGSKVARRGGAVLHASYTFRFKFLTLKRVFRKYSKLMITFNVISRATPENSACVNFIVNINLLSTMFCLGNYVLYSLWLQKWVLLQFHNNYSSNFATRWAHVQKALNKRTIFIKDSAEVGVETSPQTQNLPKGLKTVQKFLLVCWRLIFRTFTELSQL